MNEGREKRLAAFERMLADELARYEDTVAQLERLKAEGKIRTATYQQLFATKLLLSQMLDDYRDHGLIE